MVFAPPSLGKLFSVLHWQTRIFVEKQLAHTGLTWGEFHILMRLYARQQMTQSDITRQLRITKATTCKMVAKLENDGYVTRERCPRDGRTFSIRPTAKALEVRELLRSISHRWNALLLAPFSPEEQEALLQALSRLAERAVRANAGETTEET